MHKKIVLLLLVGITGIATLTAAVLRSPDSTGIKEKTAAPSRPKAQTKPPRLSEADAEYLFRRILLRQQGEYLRNLAGSRCGTRGPWWGEDLMSAAPKARLFAKAYPELAKRLTLETLQDPEVPSTDRDFVHQVLQALPDWTTDRLEELLRAEVEALDDWYTGHFTLSVLGQRDRTMRHRDLYQRQCRIGNFAAFEILSLSPHSTSVPFLEELSRKRSDPHYETAKRTLAYLRIFASPDWKKEVEARIRKPTKNEYGYESQEDFRWAVGVAQQRNLPFLLDALAERGRLERPADRWRDLSDIALSIFAELGGELTPAEFARFRQNGFCGDPEERLLEIAAQEKLR